MGVFIANGNVQSAGTRNGNGSFIIRGDRMKIREDLVFLGFDEKAIILRYAPADKIVNK